MINKRGELGEIILMSLSVPPSQGVNSIESQGVPHYYKNFVEKSVEIQLN